MKKKYEREYHTSMKMTNGATLAPSVLINKYRNRAVAKHIAQEHTDMLTIFLSEKEFRFGLMGWCKYLVRNCVSPFKELSWGALFRITADERSYICRVDEVKVFDDVRQIVAEENYTEFFPDASIMTKFTLMNQLSLQLNNKRRADYIKKHNVPPKILLLKYSLYKDPRDE